VLITERLGALTEEQTEFSALRPSWLRNCLDQLTPQAQLVLEQRYAGQSSIGAIARVLGRTASAVSVQLFGLRQKLRQCMDRHRREHAATGL
jgi:DNA-directed RNA polymerase specialized sigma24 family protein